VFTRESSLPGSGNTDLIGVAANGDILLVETKLAKNPEIRRKVIGQILEYAAFLWGMPYSDFDNLFIGREGKSLIELLTGRTSDFNSETFRTAVSENLSAGRFHLLIAVDEMKEELEKIVAYLSSRGGGLKLEALAVGIYKQGQVSVLVPQRFGQLAQPTVPSPQQAIKLSLDEILAKPTDEHTRELLRFTVQCWKAMGDTIVPGTSGVSCKADIDGTSHPIVWVLPEGGEWCIEPLFGGLSRRGAPSHAIEHFRKAVSELPGFAGKRCLTGDRPPAQLPRLNEQSIGSFLTLANEVIELWTGSDEKTPI
jgi:hypothetical protein